MCIRGQPHGLSALLNCHKSEVAHSRLLPVDVNIQHLWIHTFNIDRLVHEGSMEVILQTVLWSA